MNMMNQTMKMLVYDDDDAVGFKFLWMIESWHVWKSLAGRSWHETCAIVA